MNMRAHPGPQSRHVIYHLYRRQRVMTETNKALVRRWFREVWNQGREATIDELFAESGVAYGLSEEGTEVRGPGQMKSFVLNLRDSFPDLHISIHGITAEEDKVTVRVLLEGTHAGSGLGEPSIGGRIRVRGIVFLLISNGQFVEIRGPLIRAPIAE